MLFRSLSYFRALEHAARGDEIEGVHVDAPDNDVILESNTGIRSVGRYRYLRSVDQERVFAFCCSTELDAGLFATFDADACVAIRDPDAFFLRCRVAAKRPLPIEPPGLMHRSVAYFAPNRPAPLDITDSRNLPFLKHLGFADQREYRAVFAQKGGLKMTQRIVQPQFTFAEEIAAAQKVKRLLRLGDIRKLVELIRA